MHEVTYNSRCFFDDGKPVWLVSGAMHYFRTPHELWEDRIYKAKLAGLNCIETYIAWNLHEPEEGKFDFSGDLDIDRFFTLIEQAGLYIIVRPGPYICSEWDNGGFPAWLTSKPGIRTRDYDPVYLSAAENYFNQVLPVIARHQVTHGGKVILVQNENEYFFEGRPDGDKYLTRLNDLLRSGGIDVPIVVCNGHKVPIPDTIECVNTWGQIALPIENMQAFQPDTPKLVTEFWDGTYDVWGHHAEYRGRTSAEVVRQCFEAIGVGAMLNYYMWHGGTNFGYYAGQLFPHLKDNGTVTTSYDYYAPLSEYGSRNRIYNAVKTANWTARNLSDFLCIADPVQPEASVDGPFLLQEMKSEKGSLLVIRTQTDNQADKIADIRLANGIDLKLNLTDYEASVLPVSLKIGDEHTIDYTNGSILSVNPLIIFGYEGSDGVLSIDGEKIEFKYPADDIPLTLSFGTLYVTILSTYGAEHLWFIDDDSMIFGEVDFPEETGAKQLSPAEPPPAPGEWITYAGFPMLDAEAEWMRIDSPKSMDELNHYFGYGWYRCSIDCDNDKETTLYFPLAGDRVHIFCNGGYIGIWGKGAGAERKPLPVTLRNGHNDLVFLVDNMGRPNTGRKVGEKKGIWALPGRNWEKIPNPAKTVPSDGIPDEAKNQWELQTCWVDLQSGKRSMTWDVDLKENESLHLSISELQEYSFVLVNGRLVYYHVALGSAWSDLGYEDFSLREFVQPGRNHIELRMLGRPTDAVPEGVALYRYAVDELLDGEWSFMPFDPGQAVIGNGEKHLLRVYKTHFKSTSDYLPLFLILTGMGKGQVYLNGKPLGRYWSIGPQNRLYIPEPWIMLENEVVIFEEEGNDPRDVIFEY